MRDLTFVYIFREMQQPACTTHQPVWLMSQPTRYQQQQQQQRQQLMCMCCAGWCIYSETIIGTSCQHDRRWERWWRWRWTVNDINCVLSLSEYRQPVNTNISWIDCNSIWTALHRIYICIAFPQCRVAVIVIVDAVATVLCMQATSLKSMQMIRNVCLSSLTRANTNGTYSSLYMFCGSSAPAA